LSGRIRMMCVCSTRGGRGVNEVHAFKCVGEAISYGVSLVLYKGRQASCTEPTRPPHHRTPQAQLKVRRDEGLEVLSSGDVDPRSIAPPVTELRASLPRTLVR